MGGMLFVSSDSDPYYAYIVLFHMEYISILDLQWCYCIETKLFADCYLGPLLTTWFNFSSGME